jgi:hypothetical protein
MSFLIPPISPAVVLALVTALLRSSARAGAFLQVGARPPVGRYAVCFVNLLKFGAPPWVAAHWHLATFCVCQLAAAFTSSGVWCDGD